jgi:hypothetical protein
MTVMKVAIAGKDHEQFSGDSDEKTLEAANVPPLKPVVTHAGNAPPFQTPLMPAATAKPAIRGIVKPAIANPAQRVATIPPGVAKASHPIAGAPAARMQVKPAIPTGLVTEKPKKQN